MLFVSCIFSERLPFLDLVTNLLHIWKLSTFTVTHRTTSTHYYWQGLWDVEE